MSNSTQMYIHLLVATLLLLSIQGCSKQNHVVNLSQTVIPSGYFIETELVDTSPEHPLTVLKVSSLGGVKTIDCLLPGKTVTNKDTSRASLVDAQLQCSVDGKVYSKNLKGYVVDKLSEYQGLRFSCDKPDECEYLTTEAMFVITSVVDMDGFSFVTTDPDTPVSFQF